MTIKGSDPYVLAGNDPDGRAGIDLGVSGTPETFVLDRHGKVRYRVVGAITPEVWSETVQPLLARVGHRPQAHLRSVTGRIGA